LDKLDIYIVYSKMVIYNNYINIYIGAYNAPLY